MAKLNSRSHNTGRIPTLRNDIVELMKKEERPMTAYDISLALGIHKSAPYRPLKELVDMKLVTKISGIDGAEFTLDISYYNYLQVTDPRRVLDET